MGTSREAPFCPSPGANVKHGFTNLARECPLPGRCFRPESTPGEPCSKNARGQRYRGLQMIRPCSGSGRFLRQGQLPTLEGWRDHGRLEGTGGEPE